MCSKLCQLSKYSTVCNECYTWSSVGKKYTIKPNAKYVTHFFRYLYYKIQCWSVLIFVSVQRLRKRWFKTTIPFDSKSTKIHFHPGTLHTTFFFFPFLSPLWARLLNCNQPFILLNHSNPVILEIFKLFKFQWWIFQFAQHELLIQLLSLINF